MKKILQVMIISLVIAGSATQVLASDETKVSKSDFKTRYAQFKLIKNVSATKNGRLLPCDFQPQNYGPQPTAK